MKHETRPPLRIAIEEFIHENLGEGKGHMTRAALVGLIYRNFSVPSARALGIVIDKLIAEKYLVRSNIGNSAPKYRWCTNTE